MEGYQIKVKWKEKCIKIFLSSVEIESLNVESLHERIANRIPSIQGKEVGLRYLDNSQDWVELSSDDLDTFIDMVDMAKQSNNRRT